MLNFFQYRTNQNLGHFLQRLEKARDQNNRLIVIENFTQLQDQNPLIGFLITDWFETIIVIDQKILMGSQVHYMVHSEPRFRQYIEIRLGTKLFKIFRFLFKSNSSISFYESHQEHQDYYDFSRWKIKESISIRFGQIGGPNCLSFQQKLKLLLKVVLFDVLSTRENKNTGFAPK